MTATTIDDVYDLLHEAHELPHGPVRLELAQSACRMAETIGDSEAIFDARRRLAAAAIFAGHAEIATSNFSWCLAKFEEEPDRFAFHERQLLWLFKAVVNNLLEFPEVTLEQIEQLRRQQADWYSRNGYNLRPIYYGQFMYAEFRGDREQAEHYMQLVQSLPRDALANCEACESDSVVSYHLLNRRWDEAIAEAQKNLHGGQTCGEVPHRTLANVLYPLAMLQRYDEADRYQRKGYRLIRHNPSFLALTAQHMAYLNHRGRLAEAVRIIERHFVWALETYELLSRLAFYGATSVILRRLATEFDTYVLDLPEVFPHYELSGCYPVEVLVRWFEAQYVALAQRFDKRDGGCYFVTEYRDRFAY